MKTQLLGNPNLTPMTSQLDDETLLFLKSLRDSPEIQKDPSLYKMFTDAISFMKTSSSLPPMLTPQISEKIPVQLSPFPSLQIYTNGADGVRGLPGTAAPLKGKGFNGGDGSLGINARNINLQLMIRNGLIAAEWESGNCVMKLGEPSTFITMQAVGGHGGHGGNGGKGGLGIQGVKGRDADRFSRGVDGERGTPGGPGGNGGEGGYGGNGGNIQVYVNREDSDLLMLLNTPDTSGGLNGKGGSNGLGGPGGKGGPGGLSYTWSEFITTGNGYMRVTRTNPGGSVGLEGPKGDDGKPGSSGKKGIPGYFQMIVNGIPYQTLYDLALKTSKLVDLTRGNLDEIYEPGEHVNLMVTVTNTGEMPTPPQNIDLSLRSGQWMEEEYSSLHLTDSDQVLPQASLTLTAPFQFQVKQQESIPEEPLIKQEFLTYSAILRRVNRSFSSVDQKKDVCMIRYPVQISPLVGKVSHAFEEKFTFSLFIQNISSIIMGKAGPQKRRVFVTFEISKREDAKRIGMTFVGKGESELKGPSTVTVEVDSLSPKSEKQLEVSFRFDNPSPDTQTKVQVMAYLHLDHLKTQGSEQPALSRRIQKRTFQM